MRPATVSRRLEALWRLCRGAQQSKRLTKVALDLRPVGIARNIYPVGLTEPKVHTLAPLGGGKMKPLMQGKRDSRVVAAQVAMEQLDAMGAERFDIGVKRADGTMLVRERWGVRQVLKSLLWLRRENLNRGHIYVRPAGVHGLSLVDDLKAGAIARMKTEGYEPAVVVETSPGNFQAWLKHGEVLDEVTSTQASKLLAARFGGDPGSADWRHFGRLAGFTNPKPERRLQSGLQPFARLVGATGRIYSQAAVFLAEVRAVIAADAQKLHVANGETVGQGDHAAGQGGAEAPPLRPLAEFHRDPRYSGDLHRADMAWARHAASMGLSAAEIGRAIKQARDLSKKGNLKRQHEYIERTANKAVRQAE